MSSIPAAVDPVVAPATPTVVSGIPTGVLASAQSVLNQVQNVAHASVAALSGVVLGVETIVGTLHSMNIDTTGANMQLVGISGGLLVASKVIDSVSWSSILRIFGVSNG
jgi:hypothetical protein